MPFTSGEDIAELGEGMLREVRSDEFPYLSEVVTDLVLKSDYDFRDEFEFGLDLVLDALETLRAGQSPGSA